MAIQTQKFNPLTHRHYKLATTQEELDEEARRKAALQNQNNAARAQIANMQQQNANNRANAQINQENKKLGLAQQQRQEELGLAQQQQEFSNKLSLAEQGRKEKELSLREQAGKRDYALAQKREKQNDYQFSRQQQEDAFADRQRAEQEKLKAEQEYIKNTTLAAGMLGGYLKRQQANGNMGEDGWIDVSEVQDKVLPVLIKGYEDRGKVFAKVTADGHTVLKDSKGPIMSGGNEFRPTNEFLSTNALYADNYNEMKIKEALGMGGKPAKEAKSFSYDEFKYYRKEADDLRETLRKLEIETPPPMQPEKDASREQLQEYAAAIAPYKALSDRISELDNKAANYMEMYEGKKVGKKSYGLTPFTETNKPKDEPKQGLSKSELINRARKPKKEINGMSKEEMDQYLLSLPVPERIKVMEQLQQQVNQKNRSQAASSIQRGLAGTRSQLAPGIQHGR